jgi:very-short-patch-repair endonuclease
MGDFGARLAMTQGRLKTLALKVSKHSKADSSQEQLLWWWLHVFFWRFWRVKRQVKVEIRDVRGYVVGEYSLDLALVGGGKKLCVEVDGEYYHLEDDRAVRDARRTRYLKSLGWHVIRFTAWEVDTSPATAAWHARGIFLGMKKKRGG